MSVRFGVYLRAMHLRYFYVPSRNCFIRIQDRPGSGWDVEIVPPKLACLTMKGGDFLILESVEQLFRLSPALRIIRRVHKPLTFILNDAGELT